MGMGMAWYGVEMIRGSLEMCGVENVAQSVEKLYGLSDKSKIPKIRIFVAQQVDMECMLLL